MQILHIAEEMDVSAGGVPAVVRDLTTRLSNWADSRVLHVRGNASDLTDGGYEVRKACPYFDSGVWAFSTKFLGCARDELSKIALADGCAHIHGVWSFPQAAGTVLARQYGVPSILSAHGMLEPWLWNQQGNFKRRKKEVYWRSIAYQCLHHVGLVHAITSLEASHLRALFPLNRIIVIPNAISMPERTDTPFSSEIDKTFCFVGRLEPKKGLHTLIEAFALAALPTDWKVNIIGPSWNDDYYEELIQKVRRLGLTERIIFHGPLFGEEKSALLRQAWALVAPSYSEVVGLVNLEAAREFIPSITTRETGLHDWEEGGGILTQPTIESVSIALRQAAGWTYSERISRGLSSFDLVRNKYSWDTLLPIWKSTYSDLAAGANTV